MPALQRARSSAAVLLLVAALLLSALTACSSTGPLRGTELTSRSAAADFALTDQFGHTRRLSEHTGDVVLLTFLYTHCPDICPVVAAHVRNVHRMLGENAGEVSILIVSVDPQRDTVEAALEYSQAWQMQETWSYLVGTEEALRPVWDAYYVDPVRVDAAESGADTGDANGDASEVEALYQGVKLRYTVDHSAPVYLIDRAGVSRVLFTLPMDPAGIAHDVSLLLNE